MPTLVTAVQLLPFMGNKESHDTNHGCPGLHLAEAVVRAETVTNMGTQTCEHIDPEDIIRVQALIPQVSSRWRLPKVVGKLELQNGSSIRSVEIVCNSPGFQKIKKSWWGAIVGYSAGPESFLEHCFPTLGCQHKDSETK